MVSSGRERTVILANMLPNTYQEHYTAPATCSILALVLVAMRSLRPLRWYRRAAGRFITRAVPSVCVLLLGLRVAAGPLHLSATPSWCSPTSYNTVRAAMLAELKKRPGGQLVIVHFSPDDDIAGPGWVYNRADLNSAKVVWAHDMGRRRTRNSSTISKTAKCGLTHRQAACETRSLYGCRRPAILDSISKRTLRRRNVCCNRSRAGCCCAGAGLHSSQAGLALV